MDKKKIIRYFHDNLQFNVHKFITIYYNLQFIKIIFNIIVDSILSSFQILNLYPILATPRNNSPPSSPVPRIKVSSEEQKLHDTSIVTIPLIQYKTGHEFHPLHVTWLIHLPRLSYSWYS